MHSLHFISLCNATPPPITTTSTTTKEIRAGGELLTGKCQEALKGDENSIWPGNSMGVRIHCELQHADNQCGDFFSLSKRERTDVHLPTVGPILVHNQLGRTCWGPAGPQSSRDGETPLMKAPEALPLPAY